MSAPLLLVLNGPNLNLLGSREPDVYGAESLGTIEASLRERFPDADLRFAQSNDEGALIDELHRAQAEGAIGVAFNAGGYTHTSVAIRDAIAAIETPVVEVHISNVYARESFRHESLIAPVCVGAITGLGAAGYTLALQYLLEAQK